MFAAYRKHHQFSKENERGSHGILHGTLRRVNMLKLINNHVFNFWHR